ncbi:hypothetical protein C5167_003692 [Papaver somniferum]|uniref:Lipoxygenase domain-containing protein n=1 Tax=Papaver somniferum TaxID=3469 RepID=A0A4Y7L4Y1_PAPSO|nr:hypothetical protein C5167_003692 [Papaver somniferum]
MNVKFQRLEKCGMCLKGSDRELDMDLMQRRRIGLRSSRLNKEEYLLLKYDDYALYNDLGTDRPILGNSTELPYPRRGRTGRKPDKKVEVLRLSSLYAVKALGHVVRPEIKAIFDKTPNEFDSFDDVLHLYEGYQGQEVNQTGDSHLLTSNWSLNLEFVKELFRSDGENPLKFPFILHY